MKAFRVLLMLTILSATATAVHAQTPLPTSFEAIRAVAQEQITQKRKCLANSFSLELVVTQDPPCWFVQTLQDTAATWQRLRTLCATGKQNAGCCEAVAGKAPVCGLALVGNVKSCEAVQTPKSCCCAKACACCESCKEKKGAAPQAQAMPLGEEMLRMMEALHGIARPRQIQPVPMAAYGYQIVQVQGVVQAVHHAKPVHFVTPELDAHCDRITQRGDSMVLEGNVLLLCKKHAQPIRIEAQCVIVNMKDGSFTVESAARPAPVLKIQETRAGSLMLGAGVNTDNGIGGIHWHPSFDVAPATYRIIQVPQVFSIEPPPPAPAPPVFIPSSRSSEARPR